MLSKLKTLYKQTKPFSCLPQKEAQPTPNPNVITHSHQPEEPNKMSITHQSGTRPSFRGPQAAAAYNTSRDLQRRAPENVITDSYGTQPSASSSPATSETDSVTPTDVLIAKLRAIYHPKQTQIKAEPEKGVPIPAASHTADYGMNKKLTQSLKAFQQRLTSMPKENRSKASEQLQFQMDDVPNISEPIEEDGMFPIDDVFR